MVSEFITFVVKSYYIYGKYYIYGQFLLHLCMVGITCMVFITFMGDTAYKSELHNVVVSFCYFSF